MNKLNTILLPFGIRIRYRRVWKTKRFEKNNMAYIY